MYIFCMILVEQQHFSSDGLLKQVHPIFMCDGIVKQQYFCGHGYVKEVYSLLMAWSCETGTFSCAMGFLPTMWPYLYDSGVYKQEPILSMSTSLLKRLT